MNEIDENQDRAMSGVERTEREKKDIRIDNNAALIMLLAIAMLPSYVIPAPFAFQSQNCTTSWLVTFLCIVTFSALFNYITLKILNRVADVKQMDSFQEVAYNISNSNRGYIFLISAAKFIFLAITASYTIDYCASYLTQLCLLGHTKNGPSSGMIYFIYLTWVLVLGTAIFFPYRMVFQAHKNESKCGVGLFASIFAVCFVIQLLIMFVTIMVSVMHSSDSIQESFLAKQLRSDGFFQKTTPGPVSLQAAFQQDSGAACQVNQIIIGYIPALFYSNMFSLSFLEMKSLTKISDNKSKKDFSIGLKVILAIFISYVLMFAPMLISNVFTNEGDNQKRHFVTATFNALVALPDPFNSKHESLNIFDLTYIVTMVMMLSQAIVMLHIARENLLIFVEEHMNQKLSKTLDWKNRGMDSKSKGRRAAGGEQPANRLGDHTSSGDLSQERLLNNNNQRVSATDDGISRNTGVGANTSANGEARGGDKEVPTQLVSNLLLVSVVAFALMNCATNNILAHFWVVIAAIVCPLLDMFIPGIFYFRVMKEEDDEEDDENAKCNKFKRCCARFYTFLGALLLPLLLTLATKALFSTTREPPVSN